MAGYTRCGWCGRSRQWLVHGLAGYGGVGSAMAAAVAPTRAGNLLPSSPIHSYRWCEALAVSAQPSTISHVLHSVHTTFIRHLFQTTRQLLSNPRYHSSPPPSQPAIPLHNLSAIHILHTPQPPSFYPAIDTPRCISNTNSTSRAPFSPAIHPW